jgi:hypothetical protein
MTEMPDSPEWATPPEQEEDDNLHKSFQPDNSSRKGDNTGDDIEKVARQKRMGLMNRWQGELGEGVAKRIATEKLDCKIDNRFEKKDHGIDLVAKDKDGQFVVIEAKLTDESFTKALGKEMTLDWLKEKVQLMQTEGNKLYSENNAKIGREIQDAGGENVRRVVIFAKDQKRDVIIYEAQPDMTWKEQEKYSLWEFPEYPYWLE